VIATSRSPLVLVFFVRGTEAMGSIVDFSRVEEVARVLFGGDALPPAPASWQVALRAGLLYLVGLALVRLGKSRLIGRISPVDVLVGFMLGSLLARGITGNASLSGTTTACAALVGIHWAFTRLAVGWHAFGNLVKGHAHLLVRDGQVIEEAMRQSHISMNDLLEQLRLNGVDEVRQVRLAYKERNGEISVIRRPATCCVLEIPVQEGVQKVRVEIAS
jgi:uncharacterized membrane protein YcaP (DUF421 family)